MEGSKLKRGLKVCVSVELLGKMVVLFAGIGEFAC